MLMFFSNFREDIRQSNSTINTLKTGDEFILLFMYVKFFQPYKGADEVDSGEGDCGIEGLRLCLAQQFSEFLKQWPQCFRDGINSGLSLRSRAGSRQVPVLFTSEEPIKTPACLHVNPSLPL